MLQQKPQEFVTTQMSGKGTGGVIVEGTMKSFWEGREQEK